MVTRMTEPSLNLKGDAKQSRNSPLKKVGTPPACQKSATEDHVLNVYPKFFNGLLKDFTQGWITGTTISRHEIRSKDQTSISMSLRGSFDLTDPSLPNAFFDTSVR